MTAEDIDFIKKLVLRFMDIYPVPPKDARGYSLNELCLYLTSMCPALSFVSFKNSLSSILDEMLADGMLVSVELYNYQVKPAQTHLLYLLLELGKASAKLIHDFTLINIILEVWMKDMIVRNYVLQRYLPFQRYTMRELEERFEFALQYMEEPRRSIMYDSNSFERFFDFLKRAGFIREYEKERYKFTKRGKSLIEIGNYDTYTDWIREEKDREIRRQKSNDLLVESNIANAQIQQNLLWTNRWIALAGIAAAIYYLLEVHLELKYKRPEFYDLIFPFLLTFEMALISVGTLAGIWYFLKKYPKDNKME